MISEKLEALATFLKEREVACQYDEIGFWLRFPDGDGGLDAYDEGEDPKLAFLLMDLLEKEWRVVDLYYDILFQPSQPKYSVSLWDHRQRIFKGNAPTRTEALIEACLAVKG